MQYRAWIVDEPNGAFREGELSLPTPGPDQVLIRITSSCVNPLDTKIRAGNAGHARQPLPAVLGLDMAGTVTAIGAGVSHFKPGDEVFGMVGGVGGHQGTLAEYILADAVLLAHKPKALSMREAAALPLITITAWEGLVDRAKVHAGQSVLIHAGAGGVGHIAVQIARAFGATVFATVSAEKKHIVESYGATPIDYRTLTVERYVAQYTNGEGFDIVYDTVGGPTLDASFLARQALHRSRAQLPRLGHARACPIVVPWSHLFRRLHAHAAAYRLWPRSSRRNSRTSRKTCRRGQASPIAQRAAFYHCRYRRRARRC